MLNDIVHWLDTHHGPQWLGPTAMIVGLFAIALASKSPRPRTTYQATPTDPYLLERRRTNNIFASLVSLLWVLVWIFVLLPLMGVVLLFGGGFLASMMYLI